MENVLDPNETVLWSGKPEKKALVLPNFVGGILIALFFLAVSSVFPNFGTSFPSLIIIPVAVALIVVPPIWQYRKVPQTEYLITNQRLIIKSGITKQDVWFSELDKIKDTKVEIGFVDKLLGTGKLYPITDIYPYAPELGAYSEGGMYAIKRVYNIAEQRYDEITEFELYKHDQTRPRLEALTEPYVVQKLLKEAIFGAGTNFVNCKYCNFRFDLNKEGKCPNCGAPQSHEIFNIG